MDEDSEQLHLVARCWRCQKKDAAESRAQHDGTEFGVMPSIILQTYG